MSAMKPRSTRHHRNSLGAVNSAGSAPTASVVARKDIRHDSPEDKQKHARRLKRAITAMGQTLVRAQFVNIENTLDVHGHAIDQWIGDPNRFDSGQFNGLAYAYGYIVGIADAFHVTLPMLTGVFQQTCDRCGEYHDRLMTALSGPRMIDLCRKCVIMGDK